MAQFDYALECYKIYALQAGSRSAKTSFVKSLFRNPFMVTVQGATTLNLKGLTYGVNDALILDNINDLQLVLDYRALLQSNLDLHKLGESQTGVFSYDVFLWAVPSVLTIDLDVEVDKQMQQSEWLRANILLDVLPKGVVTYCPGPRKPLRMRDIPKLKQTK